MRLASSRRRARPLPLTSMIDVIFLLLLFFMLSTRFSDYSELNLIQSSTARPTAEALPTSNVIVLELGQENARLNLQSLTWSEVIPQITALQNDAQMVVYLSPFDDLDMERMMEIYQEISKLDNTEIIILDVKGAR